MKKEGNRGLWWSFFVIFIVLLIDQILKIWVKTHMTLGQEIPVIGNWFKLLFIENKTYGVCCETGRLIPKERLRCVPITTRCLDAKLKKK